MGRRYFEIESWKGRMEVEVDYTRPGSVDTAVTTMYLPYSAGQAEEGQVAGQSPSMRTRRSRSHPPLRRIPIGQTWL